MTANHLSDKGIVSPSQNDSTETQTQSSNAGKKLVTDGGPNVDTPSDTNSTDSSSGIVADSLDDGSLKSTETDFTQEINENVDDEDLECINRNREIADRIEDIVEREDGLDVRSGPARVAIEWGDDDDVTPEFVLDIIDDHFVVESNDVVRRKTGIDGMVEGDELDYVSWDDVMDQYNYETESGRHAALKKLDQDYHWMFVRNEEQEIEDFRFYDENTGTYVWGGVYKVGQILEANIGKHYSKRERNEIAERLQVRNEVFLEETNAGDRPLRCVKNGVLNVRTWELLDHSPEYYFTRSLNAKWDEYVDTREVEAFIRDITATEEDALVLEELFGDTLSKHYDREWFTILYGEGANGKTVALNCLRTVLRKSNVAVESLQDIAETRWSVAQIIGEYGSIANIDPDIDAKRITASKYIKNLTGGDGTSAEYKNRQKFGAENTAKLLFAANIPPMFKEKLESIKRRIKPLHLPYTFKSESEYDESNPMHKRRDTAMESKLTTEENLSAWLKVMAIGLERLRVRGEFSYSKSQDELFDEYQHEADTLWAFIDDCLQNMRVTYTDNDAAVYLTLEEIHGMYAKYCHERDETAMRQETFGREINQTGQLEMETFYPRRSDQVAARKFVVPTEVGWNYALTSTKKRFELHVDEIDVPTGDVDASSTAGGAEIAADGGADASAIVTSVIAQLEMGDVSTPTYEAISTKVGLPERPDDKRLSPSEVEETLEKLLREGTIEFDAKTASYRTAETAD